MYRSSMIQITCNREVPCSECGYGFRDPIAVIRFRYTKENLYICPSCWEELKHQAANLPGFDKVPVENP